VVQRSTVEYGTEALSTLAAHVSALGARSVLLVTGRASFEASGASAVVESLESVESVAKVERWCEFSPNTDATDLWTGLQHTADMHTDVVIGIGGGSVMDMAKLLTAFPSVTSEDELHEAIRAGGSVDGRSPGLMLAPTTSGSGSEATHFAVVYIGADKFSIAGPALRADVVALDPRLAMSGSAHQRATSGMDAVCQAIESRWAVGATRGSRRNAEFALHFLLGSLEDFVSSPTLETARAIQLGSHLAGRAIDVSKTTAAHALSYGITKQYGIDHGNAAALTLGRFIEAHAAPGARLQAGADAAEHQAAMDFVLEALDADDGPSGHHSFTDLLTRVGLPATLATIGATDADMATLAAGVNTERLGNNPVDFDAAGLRDLLLDN